MKRIFLYITLFFICNITMAQNKNDEWKKIDSLIEDQSLPQSALTEVEKLYNIALKEKDYPEVIKALIYRIDLQSLTQENPLSVTVNSLLNESEKLPQPAKSVVYSLIGDVYKSYYQNNRWQIRGRTSTAVISDNVETWDITHIFQEALKYYTLSVQDENSLQQTPIDNYNAVLNNYKSTSVQVLPTLFDLLVHKLINAYSNEMSVVLPQQTFVLNNPEYFAAVQTFVELPISTEHVLSAEYQTINLYQKLLAFRLQELKKNNNETNRFALANIDTDRLQYIKDKGIYADNNVLYEKAMKATMLNYNQQPEWAYPAYALAMLYKNQGEEWRTSKIAEHRFKYKESYDLCAEILNKFPESIIKDYAQSLQNKITATKTQLTIERQQYPNTPILALAKYRNVDKLYIAVYKIDDEYAYKTNNSRPLLSNFVGKLPAKTQEVTVPSQADHHNYSAEIKIDELPQGLYTVFVSDKPIVPQEKNKNQDYTNGTSFQVSTLNIVIRSGDNRLFGVSKDDSKVVQAYVTDRKTGQPIKNAKLDYYTSTNDLEASYYTNEQGIAYIKKHENKRPAKVVVTDKKNRLLLYGWDHNSWYRNSQEPRNNVLFFTDRAIYRPGQTVYYKALYLKNDNGNNSLISKGKLNVEFKDVNYKTIDKQTQTTNGFGSIQGSFTIPHGLLNGNMTLLTEYGGTSVQVEEYKRPTFEVKFDTITKNYTLNDNVTVTGAANALAGYAVDNSKVQYRVVRNVQYRQYRWWFPPIAQVQREIASGEVTTDSKGVFKIEFNADADDIKNTDLVYNYNVTADITDANGETRGAELTVKLSKKPMLIENTIPSNIIDRTKLNFDVVTTNLNGDPTPADVTVSITALKSPERILKERLWAIPDTFAIARNDFYKLFPADPYGDENVPEKYAEGKLLSPFLPKESSFKTLETANSGWYRIDIKAKTPQGLEVDDVKYIYLAGNPINNSKTLQVAPAAITSMTEWITTIKSSGEPGENAEFWIAGGESKSYMRYDIIFKDKILEQKEIIAGTTPERIVIPIDENLRGGFAVLFVMTQNNRIYKKIITVNVPYPNKQLDIAFTTFRNKLLPGEKEKWTLLVKNKQGEKEMAEMVATLYDASLDSFIPHQWDRFNSFYPKNHYYYLNWDTPEYAHIKTTYNGTYKEGITYNVQYPNLKTFSDDRFYVNRPVSRKQVSARAFDDLSGDMDLSGDPETIVAGSRAKGIGEEKMEQPLTEVATRQNFNETAFFYPQLLTNEKGEIIIEFTIPEALTRWKMLGFAHTADLKIGDITNELITQKQVAISANAPRFLRENDIIEFTAKVNNITENDLNGQAMLRLYNAANMQPIDATVIKTQQTQNFSVKAGESSGVKWTLSIPAGIQAINYKVTAQAGNHTDGEEKIIPVLSNTILVTETMPFSVRAGQQKNFTFKNLKENKSGTLRNYMLTLEFTSNPAWYAVQAMPYLMESSNECSEQVFSRFYANSLSAAVVNSSPRIKQIFDMWRNIPENKESLISNLEKNQELKQVMLEETPWVMQAENETERKKRVGLLFDLNKLGGEQQRAFDQLKQAQLSNGGFPWFNGLLGNIYITQHIVAGMEHLKTLNALDDDFTSEVNNMIGGAFMFMDNSIKENYDDLLKRDNVDLNSQNITPIQIHYLYASSFGKHKPENKDQLVAFDYYLGQAKKYWNKFNIYSQATTALTMSRFGEQETANAIIRSLKERSQKSEEMGMYWKDNVAGYFWYQAPIETQALLIEAFSEVANDKESIEEMRIWLLRNKQTGNWRTTKATTEACYALLMTGDDLLSESQIVDIKIGGKQLAEAAKEEIKSEPGTGYVKTSWTGSDISGNMAELSANNPNKSGIAWGGVYWQYLEQLDKIKNAETNLKMNKHLFLKHITSQGAELVPLNKNLKVGDIVTVRMELRADRDFEYVHLKDMRASGLEPIKTISGYQYQDGLWFYESIKDASTNFFIPYLKKGIYVFEYELRVTHAGEFSNGITTFQCMYAPEFSSHSEGIKVKVKQN